MVAPTFIDLFAGIGGMRAAFQAAGCRCVFSSEWNEECRRTYKANFGEEPAGDITKIPSSGIPEHDILVAGFPCQPFSIAGIAKRRSVGKESGFQDKTQGTLFFEVARIINDKRPKAFLLENVKNLRSHDGGNTIKVIRETLSELGYETHEQVVDAAKLVPQHRERLFIVGFREWAPFQFPLLPDTGTKVSQVLQKRISRKYTLTDKVWACLQRHAEKHAARGNGFGYQLVNLEGKSRTLSARYYKDGSEILVPQPRRNPRRLTPRECARLMGYAEDFRIPVSNNQAYRQFGNSVVVPVVKEIAVAIVAALAGKPVEGVNPPPVPWA